MFDFNYNDFSGVACKSRNSCGNWAIASRDCVRSAMLNIVHQDVFVHDFSEIGVIMLMFILEWNVNWNY